MADKRSPSIRDRRRSGSVARWLFPWALLVVFAGCGQGSPSAGKSPEELEKETEAAAAEAKIPPFEPQRIAVLPAPIPREDSTGGSQTPAPNPPRETLLGEGEEAGDLAQLANDGLAHILVKQGHWIVTRHQLRSNKSDLVATLNNQCVDRNLVPVPLPDIPATLKTSRRVSLPKKQSRLVELPMLVPVDRLRRRFLQLSTQIGDSRGERELWGEGQTLAYLNAYQYHAVVLSDRPDRFAYLRMLPCVTPPRNADQITELPWAYLIHRPPVDEKPTLPENALEWTSIAFMIWDGMDSTRLSESQLTALVDWIHWGGQLLINGPRSSQLLQQQGRLHDLLPVSGVTTGPISAESLATLDQTWSRVPSGSKKPAEHYRMSAAGRGDPLEGQRFELAPGARAMSEAADLIVERRVGRGRIAVSAFDLADRRLIHWPAFDGFLNACLLRRGPRYFALGDDGMLVVRRPFSSQPYGGSLENCGQRFFTRSATREGGLNRAAPAVSSIPDEAPPNGTRPSAPIQSTTGSLANSRGLNRKSEGFSEHPEGGVNAWDDFALPPQLAREALRDSAGITIPSANRVGWMLGGYLVLLVPVNWAIFRLLGRVEWAWFAAPVIAICGAITVTRLAQLDIGFVRSQSILGILELQPDYSRGHLSRFIALYSSLTTNYRVRFDQQRSVVVPFADEPSARKLWNEVPSPLVYRYGDPSEMSGFRVISNSTGMLRAEQFVELGGSLRIQGAETDSLILQNDMNMSLREVRVVARVRGEPRIAVMDALPSGGRAEVIWTSVVEASLGDGGEESESLEPSGESRGATRISLKALRELALDASRLEEGECRLAAWTDHPLEPIEFTPAASQSTGVTLVVANLRYPAFVPAVPDQNSIEEVDADWKVDGIDDVEAESGADAEVEND